MGAQLVQFADGSAGIVNDSDGKVVARWGGASTPSSGNTSYRVPQVAVTPLGVVDTGGGIFSLQNSLGYDVLVTRLLLNITTAASTAVSQGSFGYTTTSTGSTSNLIDTLSLSAATGLFDNITDKSTNGKSRQIWVNGNYLTGSKTSGSASGLAGYAYIEYVPV
jgi:hypothetical protein